MLGIWATSRLISLCSSTSFCMGGEYVTAFAALLGANEETQPVFLNFFQERYEVLFPSEETTALEMLEALKVELAKHPDLIG